MHKRGSTAQYNFENLQLTEVFRDILRKSTFNYSHAAPADTLGVLFTLFFSSSQNRVGNLFDFLLKKFRAYVRFLKNSNQI